MSGVCGKVFVVDSNLNFNQLQVIIINLYSLLCMGGYLLDSQATFYGEKLQAGSKPLFFFTEKDT
jgi:hypothetical protein